MTAHKRTVEHRALKNRQDGIPGLPGTGNGGGGGGGGNDDDGEQNPTPGPGPGSSTSQPPRKSGCFTFGYVSYRVHTMAKLRPRRR
jgi:hypothetical protein